jgi:putative transposase
MQRIDQIYLKKPYYGSRRMAEALRQEGYRVNRKRVQRLMRLMGLKVFYPRPKRTSQKAKDHRIYPYLLRDREVERPNEVWCSDITYIPVRGGYFYLVVVLDWYSRKVLSWGLSNTMEAGFCRKVLEDALEGYGKPEIFNTDQGSQYTSREFLEVLEEAGVAISMDGRGRWQDNRIVERFWRSLKYECVYLQEFEGGKEARETIGRWIESYNRERPHFGLGWRTPDEVYFGGNLPEVQERLAA